MPSSAEPASPPSDCVMEMVMMAVSMWLGPFFSPWTMPRSISGPMKMPEPMASRNWLT
ncbi:hypothetical protein D3C71_1922620 [compost metagenome]